MYFSQIKKRNRGFTLIEIMVVVVILGILASIVVPQIMKRPEQARQVKAKQDIAAISSALELYKMDNGFYPTNDQGLKALVEKPQIDPIPQNWQLYLKKLPQDPWGASYQYRQPGQHGEMDVFTKSPEGEIGNWQE